MKPLFALIFIFFSCILSAQPINDDPCPTSSNPPIDLTDIFLHIGTTCDAVGYADDPNADFPNIVCDDSTEENAVWYTFTNTSSSGLDGYLLEIENVSIIGPVTIELYKGNVSSGCTGDWTLDVTDCSTLPISLEVSNCNPNNEIYWIKIGTKDSDCGDFTISITPANASCERAESCFDIIETELSPITTNGDEINYSCTYSCLDFVCPNNTLTYCGMDTLPTVWFRVELDENAQHFLVSIDPNGNWTPMWNVYYGPSCNDLSVMRKKNGEIDCKTAGFGKFSVRNLDFVYIAISLDSNELPVDDLGIDICVATINQLTSTCLGNETDCEPDPSTIIEITGRSGADGILDPDGDGLAGPFIPGELVDIHISFFYDASTTSADWLIGMIPDFGNGWNIADFDKEQFAPSEDSNMAGWYEVESGCAPLAKRNFPHLCTYVDDEGTLRLCDSRCETCDCEGDPLAEFDALPSGYFWLTNGGNFSCENDCSPSTAYGIGSSTSTINWNFQLQVRELDDMGSCEDHDDLQISFHTFSDAGAGCYLDSENECLSDKKQFGPQWKVECEVSPKIIVDIINYQILSGAINPISLSTSDGSEIPISVFFEENSDVSGAHPYEFINGSGVINDTLINLNILANEIESLSYHAMTIIPNNPELQDTVSFTIEILPCNAINGSFEVIILDQTIEIENNSMHYDSLFWIFGDGNTSGDTNPTYTYSEEGNYTIELQLFSSCDTLTVTKNIEIDFCEEVIGSFEVNVLNQTIVIENNSLNYDYIFWIFGDGNSSLSISPTYTYSEGGNYELILILSNSCSIDTLVEFVSIPPVGVLNKKDDFLIEISPNPSDGNFKIEMDNYNDYNIKIYNTNGSKLFESEENGIFNSNQANFDFKHLENGLYLIVITQDSKSTVLKLIIN